MAKIDEQKVSEFTNLLFAVLDELQLFPISLVDREATPTRLEKYPRLLFGYFRRYENVEAAVEEWKSKILRVVKYQQLRENIFPALEKLKTWCISNRELFEGNKITLQHLRGSLFARVYQYLYPKRMISKALAIYFHKNSDLDKNVSDEELSKAVGEIVKSDESFFPIIMELESAELEKLKEAYLSEWQARIKDARRFFLSNIRYYCKIVKGEKSIEEALETEEINYQEELGNE